MGYCVFNLNRSLDPEQILFGVEWSVSCLYEGIENKKEEDKCDRMLLFLFLSVIYQLVR